jgi:FixJ family two-component response regulator
VQTEIAIVDDDGNVRASLARLLKACSYNVRTYESAKEFLNSKQLQLPDCLIVDQNMEEMTGEELLQHLARSGIRIPTVVLTGHDKLESRIRFQEAGAVNFLVKPVTPDQLLRAIETALSTSLLH